MIKFDPDSDYQKHRDVSKGVHYTQNGHAFTAGLRHIGKATGSIKPVKDKKQTSAQKGAKERASEKLKGFADPEVPDEVQSALKENKEALAAEEHA